MSVPPRIPLALLLFAVPASGLVIRGYDPERHDRFEDFPAAPARNPDQLDAGLDLSGIAWQPDQPGIQFALVSREHVLFATHFRSVANHFRFLGTGGEIVERSALSKTTVRDAGKPTDLLLVRLDAPVPADLGVSPLPYLDLPADGGYHGLTLGVAGRRNGNGGSLPAIGRAIVNRVNPTTTTETYHGTEYTNRFLRFHYIPTGGDDDCHFQTGDSGGPSYVSTHGRAALVGVHSAVEGTTPAIVENFDLFVPHYVPELDALMAPLGYRMRPVNAGPTTLSRQLATTPETPRRGRPLDLVITLENTGGELTGNLEIDLQFASGHAPDTFVASGWSASPDGASTLRRATLAAGETTTVTARWDAAPVVDALSPVLTIRSDTVAEQTATPLIPLAPSFAAWAEALTEPGELDDPDGDGLPNLLEYALGGDPDDGNLRLPNGEPVLPTLAHTPEGDLRLTHPRRTDTAARGLAYRLEFSENLASWTDTEPPGFEDAAAPYAADVEGFEKRRASWPADSGFRFVRLRVALDE